MAFYLVLSRENRRLLLLRGDSFCYGAASPSALARCSPKLPRPDQQACRTLVLDARMLVLDAIVVQERLQASRIKSTAFIPWQTFSQIVPDRCGNSMRICC
jgi:hypothetical protein